MIDVGGGSVKLRVTSRRGSRAFDSGDKLNAGEMALRVLELTRDWSHERVSIGYPGRVHWGRPAEEPPRLGNGWVKFDYERALGRPVRVINDAAMQALAAYRGGRMLFIGLGTGLGSTFIADNVLVPLELGLLRFQPRHSLFDDLSAAGLQRLGVRSWRLKLTRWVFDLAGAFRADEVVLGGGNASQMSALPKHWRRHRDVHTLLGAERLWGDARGVSATAVGSTWHIQGIELTE
jgi:polyphosphate glucokinase